LNSTAGATTPRPHLDADQSRPSAVVSLDASLARLGKRFDWGHIEEDAYRAEWARLRAQREELVGRTAERALPPLPLVSLMQG